ncbi:DUF3857 domain-containing protein [Lacinutrix himadriensis]|uniref:DUF3857 domain-containing protein n=1 Tax=Lacinutrix himadriensis TaxID=641549 RepID=UPI000AD048CF|nr:DUF3857 domain-containing protein [Lacinutrix himadriensis]
MISRQFLLIFFFIISVFSIQSQDENLLKYKTIPFALKENANAVIRSEIIHFEIKDYDQMVYTNKRIVTILNKEGDSKQSAFQHYDKNTSIKRLEARIYNAQGEEIKKIKEKDFLDVSAVSGGTLYSDNRVKYLKYTPTSYPYTIKFETEVVYKSTAFLYGWRPIEGFYASTENAEYKITNLSDAKVRIQTLNFESYNINKKSEYHFIAENLKAIKSESYSPSFKTYAPYLKATLTDFNMEGVRGVNNNWQDFGKWMYDELITGTEALPQTVKDEIRQKTALATSDREKAKIVYAYMQNKTRYISVQVGIGGWKPMLAKDVDRLGYGDCKALTNYTKSLLTEVGVVSYYTVVHGDYDIIDIDKDFSSLQGNHVILSIPDEEDYVWLECTSQTSPFAYNANFTDDRDVLVVTPEGGKIVHTKVYTADENTTENKAKIQLEATGDITAQVEIISKGARYSHHYYLENELEKDQKLHYKESFNTVNNLEILSVTFNNNKEDIVFKEKLDVKAKKYASKLGERILLKPNVFIMEEYVPPRYKNRKLPFQISRGKVNISTFEIELPNTLQVEALQDSVTISNKFGDYHFSIIQKDENTLLFNRKFKLKKGDYTKEEYKAFRDFLLLVAKHDKSKIVLKSN